MIDESYQLILVSAFLGLVSIALLGLSRRLGAPSLLLFLLVGMLAGEDGLGGLQFSDVETAFLVGNIALAVILLDGGLRTHISSFRVGLKPALTLATLGVIITSGTVGAAAAWVLGWPLQDGLLLGAIIGSTDAAAVFALLNAAGLQLKQRSSATLEIESGTNDPMAIFLTIALVTLLTSGDGSVDLHILGDFFRQMGLGALMGIGGGWLLQQILNRIILPHVLYPLLVMSGGLTIFSLTNLWQGSGFLAIYLIGLVVANRPMNHIHEVRWLHDGLAWLSQIGMFLLLGLLVSPSGLLDPKVAIPALAVSLTLMFFARPLAVFICLLPFRFPAREQFFISWVGLKGAVPIILALFPYLYGMEHKDTYFEITFFVVLLSLCLQGWTIAPLARSLGLEVPPKPEDIDHLGVTLPGQIGRELLAYRIHAGSPADSYLLRRLPIPSGVKLLGVIRGDTVLPPEPDRLLQPDDYLVLMAQSHHSPDLVALFMALPTPAHLLGTAFFGQFTLRPEVLLDDLCKAYGVSLSDDLRRQSLSELINKHYHGKPVVGDRVNVGDIELVVKQMAKGKLLQVGLKLPVVKQQAAS
ncbi:potassium/proton antiporter [Sediminihaliea albiluteola]|uniref:potassium/proton antiporter n=1 Tax=Sediminihaliea albiluteola TaxID=2758564 RepID=UPI001C70E927|nr:potassium/proton antiporter [Sediminihaliea albiluteola]